MITIEPARHPLTGSIQVPGDKSISHRSIMFGALAEGRTEITGFLSSADCLSTIDCFRAMGIRIEQSTRPFDGEPVITVHGKGLHGLTEPESTLYTGNSGTTTRLMTGILAGQPFDSRITGDASIETRPMARIITPLTQMGAEVVSVRGNGCTPLAVKGGKKLHGISYHSPIASAQVKSCILLAGLYADQDTVVYEPALSRNHTELMLRSFGADIRNETDVYGAASAILHPGATLQGMKVDVPGDISSAAYFIAAALMVPDSALTIRNVGINPTRAGILAVLQQMGAEIELQNVDDTSDPRADLFVRHTRLGGGNQGRVEIAGRMIPTLIDELPMLAVLGAVSDCEMIVRDAAELKVKESDRIAVVCENLRAMGGDITPTEDGFVIRGGRALHGANIRTHGDHRIAMSFAVAGLAAQGTTCIDDETCVSISYPEFFRSLMQIA